MAFELSLEIFQVIDGQTQNDLAGETLTNNKHFIHKFLGLNQSNGELGINLVVCYLYCSYFIPQFL